MASSRQRGRKGSVRWDEDHEILARLTIVATMMNQGAKAHQIADALGQAIRSAYRDMERVRELWRRENTRSVLSQRDQAIAQYEEIKLRAWETYRNSADPKVKLKALETAMDAQAHIDDLQGTKQRVGIDMTSGGLPLGADAKELSDDQLRAIAAGIR